MFMTFNELERRAYINGRTFLAKAYAAAEDALTMTQDVRGAAGALQETATALAEKAAEVVKQAEAAATAAEEISENPEPELGLWV